MRQELNNIKHIVEAKCHTKYDFSPENVKKVKMIFHKYNNCREANSQERIIIKESSRYLRWNEILNDTNNWQITSRSVY